MKTVTLHTEIGFNVNVQIIQDALNLYFNITDDYLAKPMAQQIWIRISSSGHPQCMRDSKVWGTAELVEALGNLNFRMKQLEDQILASI